jgi:glyoxylase-like metal-dependent hydrolase (beta-lactamase superfamily II)
MVVDTGMGPRNAEIVLQEVRKISDKEITYLAITHFHPEHGMGAQSFPETTNIVVPTAQKQELADKGEAYIELFNDFSPEIADLLSDVKLVIPDLAFENKLEIDLGGTTVQLFHFDTAHTRGDMFVFLPEQKILFGGDIIINRFFPIMPDGDSRALGWINSLTELKALKPEIVVPGHGAVADISLIDQLLVFLTNLKQRVAESKTQGLSLAQAQELLIPEFQKKYSNWDESNWIKNAVERFYAEI